MVPRMDQNTYKVLFLGIANDTAEGRKDFTRVMSKRFQIPPEKFESLISKPPVLLKRGLSLAKAEALVKEFRSMGGRTQLIAEEETPLLQLEFEADKGPLLQLESLSSSFQGGKIEVTGRVRNISSHPLRGVKVIAQFFDSRDQFIIYEESPIAFSFLHPDQFSPFKVIREENTQFRRISVAFTGEDGAVIGARIDNTPANDVVSFEGNHPPDGTEKRISKMRIPSSRAVNSLLEGVVSRISKETFTQADVEGVLREMFPREWTFLERKYEGVDGGSARQYLSHILSRYAQEQESSVQPTGTFVEGVPGSGTAKMAVYRKIRSGASRLPRASLSEFDGQSPLRNFACPKISQKSSSSIARAIIKGYNEEKIPHDLRNFNHLGFNAKSLIAEEDTLVRFLSLVLFDRWPFRPWEMIWDEEGGSIHSLLRTHGLFHVSEIRKAPLDEIESRLRRCISNGGLALHTDGGRTRFARTLKELSLHVGRIASSMKSAGTESHLISLHEDMMNVHGFRASISARCIAYAMRELGAGRTSPEMFGPIAHHLKNHWRASDWGQRLEFPLLGGRPHLFDEIMDHLCDDPLAFDYLSLVGADYCQDGHCEHCSLS